MKHDLIIYWSREISEFLFRNAEFQFSEESLENPSCFHHSSWHLRSLCTTITKHHLSLWTAHGNHSFTRCPRLVRLTCFLGRTWPTKPSAWEKANNQTTLTSYTPNNCSKQKKAGNHCLILQTTLNPHTGLTNAWDAMVQRLQVIEDGLELMRVHRPKVGKPPKKKTDLSKPYSFHSPQILRQTPLEIKSCTPPARNLQNVCF